jgi:hypothetical protein
MGNIMDKFRGKPSSTKAKNTLSVYSVGPLARPIQQQPQSESALPRAAAIYGAASAIFAVLTVFYLIKGIWITGAIMILPTACLGGFAYHYMKN